MNKRASLKSEQELRDQILSIASLGQVAMAMALGVELKLFEAMATVCKASPKHSATVAEVAAQAACKERYIYEWMAAMACGNLIDVDPSGQHFSMRPEHIPVWIGGEGQLPEHSLHVIDFLPGFGGAFNKVKEAFRLDGPPGVPYSAYEDTFYTVMAAWSRTIHDGELCSGYMELIGALELLQKGVNVLEAGCGAGFHIEKMARTFPNSHFTGIDLTQSAINTATTRCEGLPNVKLICGNASHLDKKWTEHFDVVFFIDSCHDMCRPDLAISEVQRVLKPGGLFSMIEWPNGDGNVYEDRKKYGSAVAALFYAASAMHCLPVGSHVEGALQLGNMMGHGRGRKLLEMGGFAKDKIEVLEPPFMPYNCIYTARK
ncbi:hypothetical protein TWF706_006165 [Orbilia oligospora]|uniref:Uncharacterized protein n=1 Tax=Orbilia oligospora TaxID=2813651 RepID=A0A7C8P1H6_ORBOL|nr:hypothetical protein TWF706_006165 [Orbilia oligospora]KAF3146774.1 hypothetical protein TWF703_004047 [Orbilia oligospora]